MKIFHYILYNHSCNTGYGNLSLRTKYENLLVCNHTLLYGRSVVTHDMSHLHVTNRSPTGYQWVIYRNYAAIPIYSRSIVTSPKGGLTGR